MIRQCTRLSIPLSCRGLEEGHPHLWNVGDLLKIETFFLSLWSNAAVQGYREAAYSRRWSREWWTYSIAAGSSRGKGRSFRGSKDLLGEKHINQEVAFRLRKEDEAEKDKAAKEDKEEMIELAWALVGKTCSNGYTDILQTDDLQETLNRQTLCSRYVNHRDFALLFGCQFWACWTYSAKARNIKSSS